jgi:choline monooxygenase
MRITMAAFLQLRATGLSCFPHRARGTTTRLHTTQAAAAWPPGDTADADLDATLLKSASLPAGYYSGAAALERDLARVFFSGAGAGAWTYAGPASWAANPGDYFTLGSGGAAAFPPPTVVVRTATTSNPRAFFNVCRHRAAPVAAGLRGSCLQNKGGEEQQDECIFTCGYHGWKYSAGRGGRLVSAPKMGGVEKLQARHLGLAPMASETVGPLVFVQAGGGRRGDGEEAAEQQQKSGLESWLGAEGAAAVRAVIAGTYDPQHQHQQHPLPAAAADAAASPSSSSSSSSSSPQPSLVHVARREWRVACDWKVYADNYLDGGYHVSVAHPKLAAGLDLQTYRVRLHGPRVSVQSVFSSSSSSGSSGSTGSDAPQQPRLGTGAAAYAWLYPNVMLNRYGPWLDVNAVFPDASPGHCRVLFDWFLDASSLPSSSFSSFSPLSPWPPSPSSSEQASRDGGGDIKDDDFEALLRRLPTDVADALRDSCLVQDEDVALCEGVQRGIDAAARFPPGAVYGSPSPLAANDGVVVGGGRYARMELPMFAFHRALWADYRRRGGER